MELKSLKEIGLTEGETKVYLTLLKLGETKTGPLAKNAKVSSSKVYKILDRLEDKGLVGYIVKGKTKYFRGLEPRRILDYLDEEEKQIEERKELVKQLLPQLEKQHELSEEGAVVYSGFKAISNFYRNILDELKSGEDYHVLGASYGEDFPEWRAFFHNYHLQRVQKNIKVKMLANYNTKNNLEKPTFLNSQIKFLPQYLMSNMTILFYKNKAFIFILTKEPKGFLIESEEVAKSFKQYFDTLWSLGKY